MTENAVLVMARLLQLWMLILAVFVAGMSIVKSPVLNRLRYISDHVYFAYALVMLLSIIQVYQCVQALVLPVGKLWWVPFFCKQLSLFLYLVILNCVAGCGSREGRCGE